MDLSVAHQVLAIVRAAYLLVRQSSMELGTLATGKTCLAEIAAAFSDTVNANTNLHDNCFTGTWIMSHPSNGLPAIFINSLNANDTTYSISVSGTGSESAVVASDLVGFVRKIDGPLNDAFDSSTFLHDSIGRVISSSNSEGYSVTMDYDSGDRPTSITFPDATSATFTYNRLDAVLIKDRIGRFISASFDSLDRVAATVDPSGRKTLFDYCECGSLKAVRDPAGNKTSWDRDLLGRVTSKHLPDGSTHSFSYDDFGRLATRTDARDVVTTFDYNIDNTLASQHYALPTGSEVAATPDVSYVWDQNYVRLLSIANSNSFNAYQYNSYITSATGTTLGGGALAQETKSASSTVPPDWTITYSHDILGRITSRDIDGETTSWTFDAISRVKSETNPLSATAFDFDYIDESSTSDKGSGILSSIQYPNGQKTTFSYGTSPNTNDWRVQQILNQTSTLSTLSQFDYTYNSGGEILTWQQQQNGGNAHQSFEYNASGELISARTGVSSFNAPWSSQQYFDYDCAGNRTSVEKGATSGNPVSVLRESVNCLNQLTSATAGGAARVAGSTDRAVVPIKIQNRDAFMNTTKSFVGKAQVAPGTNSIAIKARTAGGGSTTSSTALTVADADTQNFTYDENGNMLTDGSTGNSFKWDAEDRLVEIDYVGSGNKTEFQYDALGRNIQMVESGGSTPGTKNFVWCGLQRCQERSSTNAVAKQFFGLGEQIGTASYYFSTDHLGSVRELTE